MMVWRFVRFAVDAHYLLPRGVRHAGKNSCLRNRGIAFVFQHSADGNALVAEKLEQQSSRLIVADDADRQYVYAQFRQVVHRVCAAARNNRAVAMPQDHTRSYAGDTGNLALNELIDYQV